jgi:hypothetical protein
MASGHGHGSMSLSMKFIRLLIVLFNLAFVVVGITLLAIGIFVVKDPKLQQLRPLLNPDLTSAYSQSLSYIEIFAIAIIVIGGVLLVIGFLGCCGAIKGFRFLHVLYAVIIGAIIVAEIAIVVAFIAYQNDFRSELVMKLKHSITKFYAGTPINNSTANNSVSLSWDFAQFNLQCCGATGKNDFANTTIWNRADPYNASATLIIPFTCCPLGAANSWTQLPTNLSVAETCATTGNTTYTRGCYDRLVDILATYKNNVIIGAAIVGGVEVFAFLFSILLLCRKEDYNKV